MEKRDMENGIARYLQRMMYDYVRICGDITPIMEKNMVRGNAYWYYVGACRDNCQGFDFRV